MMSEQRASQIIMTCIPTITKIFKKKQNSSLIYSLPEIFDSEKESKLQPGSCRENQTV